MPELAGLEEEFAPKETPVPDIKVQLPAFADFDRPIEVAAPKGNDEETNML